MIKIAGKNKIINACIWVFSFFKLNNLSLINLAIASAVAVFTNSYTDILSSEGYYFYVIVANDGVRNSTRSNCEYIEYKLPSLNEFTIVSGLILGVSVLVLVVTGIRKKKS